MHAKKAGAITPLYQAGPFRLVQRKDTGTLVISGRFAGKRYRITAAHDLHELPRAKRLLNDLLFDLESGWRPGQKQATFGWEAIAKRVHARHRANAAYRGIPFDLVVADVFRLMHESNYHCPLSGIPFSTIKPSTNDQLGIRDPWAPSIDRIDNRQGYTRDNIRVVCVAANMAMNSWGFDTLLRLAKGVVRNASLAASPEPLDTSGTQAVGVGY